MASLTILKMCGRSRLSQLTSNPLLQRSIPAAVNTAVIARRDLQSQRIYGPATGAQPDYVKHWLESKYVSAACLATIPLAIALPHPVTDTLAAANIVLHTHWGFAGIIKDYCHGEIPFLMTPLKILLPLFSILAMAGLCYINFFDVGLGNLARALYTQV